MLKRYLSGLILSPFLFACTSGELTRDELYEFIADSSNGLSKAVNANDYVFTLEYQPIDLVFSNELAQERFFKQKRDSLKNAYKQFLYFRLSISRKDKSIEQYFVSNPEKYRSLISYLSSEIGRNMVLESNGEVSDLFDFAYTPLYGMSGATHVLVAFKLKNDVSETVKVIYNDNFFGCGRVEFSFNDDDIQNTPVLKSNTN